MQKFDVNWFAGPAETVAALDAAVGAGLPSVVVFLHSFSLMSSSGRKTPALDTRALANFEVLLDYISRKQLPVATMRDFAQRNRGAHAGIDVVPSVATTVVWYRYVWHQLKALPRFILWLAIAVITASALFVYRLVRRRRLPAGEVQNYGSGVQRLGATTSKVRVP
jgi:hypothetical protein